MVSAAFDIPQTGYPLFRGGDGGLETMSRAMLRSLQQQPSALSSAFFSPQNVDSLQRQLQDVVYRRTRHRIDRQSDEQLLVLMRAVFLEIARHTTQHVPAEVRVLNDEVLARAVPVVGAGLAQFLGYLHDASTLPPPLPHATPTSIKGSKTLEFRGGRGL